MYTRIAQGAAHGGADVFQGGCELGVVPQLGEGGGGFLGSLDGFLDAGFTQRLGDVLAKQDGVEHRCDDALVDNVEHLRAGVAQHAGFDAGDQAVGHCLARLGGIATGEALGVELRELVAAGANALQELCEPLRNRLQAFDGAGVHIAREAVPTWAPRCGLRWR